MHTTPSTRCPGCMALKEVLAWIDAQLRAATIKKTILARIAIVLTRGDELTARAPAWIWFPVHMTDCAPCFGRWPIDAQYRPAMLLDRCPCRGGRDIGWRRFVETVDIALDAAYRPPRCARCGFEQERCICTEVQRHLDAIEALRRGK